MKPTAVIILAAGCAMAVWRVLAEEQVSVEEIKITFAAPPFVSPTNILPREARFPQGMDAKEHGAFTNIVAGRISALNVTWADTNLFKHQTQIQSLLRELLSSTNTQTWTYHVWSFGDAEPSLVATVDHTAGKQGKWLAWCSPSSPGPYWAYQDGNGKWWWGQWNVLTGPKPKSLEPPQPVQTNHPLEDNHSTLRVESFRFIGAETTIQQVIATLGQPNMKAAGGFYDIYTYHLSDDTEVTIGVDDKSQIIFAAHGRDTFFGHSMFQNR